MNKFTTDRYDGQRCQVSIVSSSITIQGEHNAVEVRYLDEAYLLDAVCSYIKYRYMDDYCEATRQKLAAAFLQLDKRIDSAKTAA